MTWTCEELAHWLDDGRPGGTLAAATAHAAGCPACRSSLAAAIAVEEALSLRPTATAAPAGFTDAVMRRVGAAPTKRAEPRQRPVLPWWMNALADPMVAGMILLLAFMAWSYETVWSGAVRLSSGLATWLDTALQGASAVAQPAPPWLQVFASPTVLLGVGCAAAPALVWGFWMLLRWSERVTFQTTPMVGIGR